jgi:protein gp37
MGDRTGIEWCDATWNPIRGCTRVSEGCRHCYAETVAARFSGPGQPYEGLARYVSRPQRGYPGAELAPDKREARWTGKVAWVERVLDQPLRWRRPRRVFVNSMSDLFHESIPDEWVDRVFAVMALATHHTFIVLTKRPQRMRDYVSDPATLGKVAGAMTARGFGHIAAALRPHWPFRHLWLGVSAEDQATADERIPLLLDTRAAVRVLSAEPLLGPIDLIRLPRAGNMHDWLTGERETALTKDSTPRLGWVIAGGESGPGARPMHPDWPRQLRDQCQVAGVPFFFKQWGEWKPGPGGILDKRIDRPDFKVIDPETSVARVGKRAAGSLLDGTEHKAFPA